MFYLCCIFCSFFKTFCAFEFAFHFVKLSLSYFFFLTEQNFLKWIVNESSSWAMGWRNLKSREMISCDSCHESEELDSDCENKNPVTHFYDLKRMTHKYLFMVHMTLLSLWRPFLLMTLNVWRLSDLDLWTLGNSDENGKNTDVDDWLRTDVKYESYRVLILALNSNRPIRIVSQSRSFGLILGLYFATPSKIDGFTRFQTF